MSRFATNGNAYDSQLLSPSSSKMRKSPSRQAIKKRRSSTTMHGSTSLADSMDDFSSSNGQHSLAHELAAALMPEPSASSKLLAEEFGIEYDEGAEGIDEVPESHSDRHLAPGRSFADELDPDSIDTSFATSPDPDNVDQFTGEADPVFADSLARQIKPKQIEQDAMEVLSQDLESTDKFLSHLRRIDTDAGVPSAQQPMLERLASDVIRRLNESTRDREGQIRELLGYEREFKKIAGEVGGDDVLSQLDELIHEDDLVDRPGNTASNSRALDTLEEELAPNAREWEVDPERHNDDEHDISDQLSPSPTKDAFPAPPAIEGPPSAAVTIPQLAHLRVFTTSLVTSLNTISEQAQVTGAATTDAGRKIRALKNKIGGWRSDWDSAEQSRVKIEKWEAGIVEGPTSNGIRRIDGRKFVEEHLQAFEQALADAALKTKAIMATS